MAYDSYLAIGEPYWVIIHRQAKYLQKGEASETPVKLESDEKLVLDAQRPPNAFRLVPTDFPDQPISDEDPVSGKNLMRDPLGSARYYRVGTQHAIDMDCRWYTSELLYTKVDLVTAYQPEPEKKAARTSHAYRPEVTDAVPTEGRAQYEVCLDGIRSVIGDEPTEFAPRSPPPRRAKHKPSMNVRRSRGANRRVFSPSTHKRPRLSSYMTETCQYSTIEGERVTFPTPSLVSSPTTTVVNRPSPKYRAPSLVRTVIPGQSLNRDSPKPTATPAVLDISHDGTLQITGTRTVIPPGRKKTSRPNALPKTNIPGTRTSLVKREMVRESPSESSSVTDENSSLGSIQSGPRVVSKPSPLIPSKVPISTSTQVVSQVVYQTHPAKTPLSSPTSTPRPLTAATTRYLPTESYESYVPDTTSETTASTMTTSGTNSMTSASSSTTLSLAPTSGKVTRLPTTTSPHGLATYGTAFQHHIASPNIPYLPTMSPYAPRGIERRYDDASSSYTYESYTDSTGTTTTATGTTGVTSPRNAPNLESSVRNLDEFKAPTERDMRPKYGSEMASTINRRGLTPGLARNGRASCCGAGALRNQSFDEFYYNRSLMDAIQFDELSSFRGESDYTSVSGSIVKRLLAEQS